MGFNKQLKLCLVVLAVVFALVAKSSAKIQDSVWFGNYGHKGDKGGDSLIDSAHSKVGDLIGDDNEMMMDSETNRRTLAGRGKYIGYGALKRNAVPCGRRGVSYYNCQNRQEANPYKRGCTYITRCGRR